MIETILQNKIYLSIATFAIGAVIGLIIGFFIGYKLNPRIQSTPEETRERIAQLVSLFVVAIWSGSIIYDMISSSYETPLALHLISGMSFGFLLNQSIPEIISAIVSIRK